LPGDYVASGVGLRDQTSGNITISGIPAGASIAKAFLYWGVLDNGEETSLHQVDLNGTQVNGTLIGIGPDTCWGDTNSFTYRADVTSLVAGNGVYALTNVASGGAILQEGASLVIIYQLTGAAVKTVMLDDGNLSMPTGTASGSATFSGFNASSPVGATTTFMVGDGQVPGTPTTFTGNNGTLSFPELFVAQEGAFWDTVSFNVSSVIGAGNSSGQASISITGDCLLWSAQAFSVTSAPATTPFSATAGVVEAGANGDTIVNLRGLQPQDAPTLGDQIGFVVQFRTIQNPSINGTILTNQLVNGLVNDGVISPSDASTIESNVLQKLVTPAGIPTISGKLLSQSTNSPGVIKAVVQLTNTGSGNATNTQIGKLAVKTLSGSGTVTINSLSPPLPLSLPNLAVGASTTVTLYFNAPSTVTRFSVTESGPVHDVLNRLYNFSTGELLF
jgi:hypothetical protein